MNRKKGTVISKSWHAGSSNNSSIQQDAPYITESIYKIVVIGGANVGKTSVIRALCGDEFSPDKIKTFGIDFRRKLFIIEGSRVKANIWDTCFAQSYVESLPNTLKGCDGVVIVFDKSKAESFDMVNKAMQITQEYTEDQVPILILGNKVDLGEYENMGQDIKHAILGSDRNVRYREVMASTTEGVPEAFLGLMKAIVDTAHIASASRKSYRNTKNTLTKSSTLKKNDVSKRWGCCSKT